MDIMWAQRGPSHLPHTERRCPDHMGPTKVWTRFPYETNMHHAMWCLHGSKWVPCGPQRRSSYLPHMEHRWPDHMDPIGRYNFDCGFHMDQYRSCHVVFTWGLNGHHVGLTWVILSASNGAQMSRPHGSPKSLAAVSIWI